MIVLIDHHGFTQTIDVEAVEYGNPPDRLVVPLMQRLKPSGGIADDNEPFDLAAELSGPAITTLAFRRRGPLGHGMPRYTCDGCQLCDPRWTDRLITTVARAAATLALRQRYEDEDAAVKRDRKAQRRLAKIRASALRRALRPRKPTA